MKNILAAAGLLAALLLPHKARAQHIHIQTAYSETSGWSLFWHDFEGGSFPASHFAQAVASPARGRIPANGTLTNILGAAGNPVWILPQAAAPDVPAIGFGAQGPAVFSNGQIALRLATYSGPGHFALYTVGPFGGVTIVAASIDGLTEADVLPLALPGGHVHVNWAFTRPGDYKLGWQASGRLANGQTTTSEIVEFGFRVIPPAQPRLRLSAHTNGKTLLSVENEPRVPILVECSSNLVHWTSLTNLWLEAASWQFTNDIEGWRQFYRASHPFP